MKHAPTHLARHRHLRRPKQPHKRHTHINLILCGIGLIVTVWLAQGNGLETALSGLGMYRFVVIAAAGILFVTPFTAPIGGLMLSILAKQTPIWQVIALSGASAVAADMTILHALNTELLEEIEDIFNEFHGRKLIHIFHSKMFRWTLPLLVIFIIATPLPDDLAIGLLGISRVSAHRFVLSSYMLNSLGIIGMIGLFLLIHR